MSSRSGSTISYAPSASRSSTTGRATRSSLEGPRPSPGASSGAASRRRSARAVRRCTCRSGSRADRAALFERLPPALLTRDQLRMLEGPDNVVGDGGASMRRLGLVELLALDEQLRRAAESSRRKGCARDSLAPKAAAFRDVPHPNGGDQRREPASADLRIASTKVPEAARRRPLCIAAPTLDLVEALPA